MQTGQKIALGLGVAVAAGAAYWYFKIRKTGEFQLPVVDNSQTALPASDPTAGQTQTQTQTPPKASVYVPEPGQKFVPPMPVVKTVTFNDVLSKMPGMGILFK